jgi:hypothetical protein
MLQTHAITTPTLALLKKLVLLDELRPFALGGGTNIALRLGHRQSIDLDFFCNDPYDTTALQAFLLKKFPEAELLFAQNQTLIFDFGGIRVDFVCYPFPWKEKIETISGIPLISLADIVPMKLQAVSNRRSKKDFWDIAFLLDMYPLKTMFSIFKAKFPQIDIGYIVQSLTDFSEAESDFDPDTIVNTNWPAIKQKLTEAVKGFSFEQL